MNLKLKIFLWCWISCGAILICYGLGVIDQDFFSHYYIGGGVIRGEDMYKNFSDNKGPVFYLAFTILRIIFGNSYQWALWAAGLIVGSTLSCLTVLLLRKWVGLSDNFDRRQWLGVFGISVIYMSFLLGLTNTGIYAESVMMVFILLSLVIFEDRPFLAGIAFGLAILSRQTGIVWIIVFVGLAYWLGKLCLIKKFIGGSLLVLAMMVLILFYYGSFNDAWYNMVIFNIGYRNFLVDNFSLGYRFGNLLSNLKLLLILMYVLGGMLSILIFLKNSKKKIFLICFFIVSSISILSGLVFYTHNFIQFVPIFIVVYALMKKGLLLRKIGLIFNAILALVLLIEIFSYKFTGPVLNNYIPYFYSQVNFEKVDYLQLMTYYPELYIRWNKLSPDKHYQPFFIFSEGQNSGKSTREHRSLLADRVEKTLFVAVLFQQSDKEMRDVYLQKFQKNFDLVLTQIDELNGVRFEQYRSRGAKID